MELQATIFGKCQVTNIKDITLFGAAVGSTACSQSVIGNKIDNLKIMINNLKMVCSHYSFFLLKNCLMLPKLLYTLRASPCFHIESELLQFDKTMKSFLIEKLNINFSFIQYEQACLPVKLGGLGIRSTAEISLPAFIASRT